MRPRNRHIFEVLAVVLVAAGTAALALPLPIPQGLRVAAALPLVLLVPGLAISLALWPEPQSAIDLENPGNEEAIGISRTTRLLLSVGLSLAIAALGGLVLTLTPWGVQPGTWGCFLGAIALGAGLVAVLRRWTSAPAEDVAQPLVTHSSPWAALGIPTISLRQGLLLALAALVVAGAWSAALSGAATLPSRGYTELWMLPTTQGIATGAAAVRLGVRNHETGVVRYRLRVETGGRTVQEWSELDLRPGQQWEGQASWPAATSAKVPVQAVLFRADAPDVPYRHVLIWPDGEG
jgi:uncharacterized membrane protein